MKNTDKVYKVRVMKIEEEEILRVPKGVEINKEILEDSWYFDKFEEEDDDGRDFTTLFSISFSEVDKELWVEHEHPCPILEYDGDITFDY